MKTLKVSIVALATLVFGAVIFISCSNEESTVTPDSSLTNYRITNANAFINDFYRTSWTTGVSATATDSLRTYYVTEIIVGTDTRARGYLVKDKATNELLYFADVDRSNHVFRTVNLITEEEETFLDIDRHPDYSISDGFDMIKIIDDVNNDNYQAYSDFWIGVGVIIDGVFDNFWGHIPSDCTSVTVTNPDLSQGCETTCIMKVRRFWISWRSYPRVTYSSGPCS